MKHIYQHVKYISIPEQNMCIIFSYYQLIFCIRTTVFVIANTLRAGRSGHLVLVRERVPFNLKKYQFRLCGLRSLLNDGCRGRFLGSCEGGLEFKISLPFCWVVKVSFATPLPTKAKIHHMANILKKCYI